MTSTQLRFRSSGAVLPTDNDTKKMTRILILLSSLFLVGSSYGENETDKERYAECILKNIKGVNSDVAAKVVARACRERYPGKNTPNEPLAHCLLKEIKGVASDSAAKLILGACMTLHPPSFESLFDKYRTEPEKKLENQSQTFILPTPEEFWGLRNANFCVIGSIIYRQKYTKEECKQSDGVVFDQERHANTYVQVLKHGALPKTKRCYLKNELQTVAVTEFTLGLMVVATECDSRFGGNKAEEVNQVLDKYQTQLDEWGNLNVIKRIASRWGLTASGYTQGQSFEAIMFFKPKSTADFKSLCSGLEGKIKVYFTNWDYLQEDFIPLVTNADKVFPVCN